ncbi:MAG: cyclic nucleotide-binding domain-containing protein [Pseudomonadota bacterium]
MTTTTTTAVRAEDTQSDPLAVLSDLEPETVAALHRVARPVQLKAGEPLLTEGEWSNEFYIVESGSIEVFRAAGGDGQVRHITDVEPGGLLGELALVDGGTRSLSARAKSDCRLLMVSPDDLLALPDGKRLLADLKGSLGVSIVQRMRGITDNYVSVLERELETARTQQRFGQFFIYMLALMTIGTLVNNIIARHILEVDVYTQRFAWEYGLILLLPTVIVIRRMGISLSQMGLTRQGLGRSLKEGIIVSALLGAATLALSSTLYMLDMLPGKPLNDFDPYGTIGYLVHSFLQELVGRGLMQSSFQRFLNDKKGIKSVVLASTLFGLFHLHFGLSAVLLTTISGFAFGAFYLRNPNIAGVTLIHFIAGVCAFSSGLL